MAGIKNFLNKSAESPIVFVTYSAEEDESIIEFSEKYREVIKQLILFTVSETVIPSCEVIEAVDQIQSLQYLIESGELYQFINGIIKIPFDKMDPEALVALLTSESELNFVN